MPNPGDIISYKQKLHNKVDMFVKIFKNYLPREYKH